MEATTVALWVERFAFCLLFCNTNIGIGSYGIILLVLSNFLYHKCAMADRANSVTLKRNKNLKNSDLRIMEQSDFKSNTSKAISCEKGEDSIMHSTVYEILKEATNNSDAEKNSYWHEILVKKLEDEFKKYRALRDEELRETKERCEEEFKNKLKIKEETLEAQYDEDRRNWDREKRYLKEKYEMMRWT